MNTSFYVYLSLIAVISALSKIPFIAINMLLPFPEPIVWLCVVCNIISWFLLEVWALGLDADFFIKEAKINTLKGFLSASIIIVLAIISQVPNVFPAIQYNPKLYSPYIFVCVVVALSFFPIKSLILTCYSINDYLYLSDEEKEKKQFLKITQEHFLKKNVEEKLLLTNDTIKKFFNDYLGTIFPETDYLKYENQKITKYCNFGYVLGGFVTICYEWFNAEYSFHKWQEFVSDDAITKYVFSILVVITTFYLTGLSIIKMFSSLFDRRIVYEHESFKKLYFLIQLIVFLSSILSVGVYFVVVRDFYKDRTIKYLLTSTCCIAIFMILETGSYAMVDYAFDLLIEKYGTVKELKLLKMNRYIKNLTLDQLKEETVNL